MVTSGTGLDASLGLVAETTWDTPVVPTRFIGFDSETLAGGKVTVQDNGIRTGQRVARSLGRVITRRDAGGGITASFLTSGFGIFLKAATGTSTNTLHSGQTTVWDQVHTIGSLIGTSLTIQKGVPETTGAAPQPFTYSGSKVADLDLSIAAGGIAKMSVTVQAARERTLGTTPAGLALATASYSTTAVPFSFLNATLSLGGSPVAAVKSCNVKLTNPLTSSEERTYIGGSGFQAEPLRNGLATVTGTLSADFVDRTVIYDAFYNDTGLALVLVFSGPQIGVTGINNSLTINVPVVKLNGSPPQVSGPGIVNISAPFEGLYDDTNSPITYTLVTGDSTY